MEENIMSLLSLIYRHLTSETVCKEKQNREKIKEFVVNFS